MWKPPLNFITIHYAYIVTLSISSLVVLYPYGNLKAIDAYFFGASSCTESGLNTYDVKDLKTYQQLFIYVIPVISHHAFINIAVVLVRLHWFRKRLDEIASTQVRHRHDVEAKAYKPLENGKKYTSNDQHITDATALNVISTGEHTNETDKPQAQTAEPTGRSISFAADVRGYDKSKALYVPPPQERDRGRPMVEIDEIFSDDDEITKTNDSNVRGSLPARRKIMGSSRITSTTTLERVASSIFVLEGRPSTRQKQPPLQHSLSQHLHLPLSSHAALGPNSQFRNLTAEDRETLGGIEYRSLKLLFKIVTVYFFGLHLFGAVCLLGWILHSDPKYRKYLQECAQSPVWWAFYSSQTMISNLGFTLTPDSMISFRDAEWPMILMSVLAYVGNTFYPCFLRFIIWTMSLIVPKTSPLKEQLNFLLKHPRRCYTHLFPSGTTWALFAVLFLLNFVDIILMITLDLHNPAVNDLPWGKRILASLFQAASTRHTGTASFNLANVNPAVQVSILVMMYIGIFPIALSTRASNTYEQRALGIYPQDRELDEYNGKTYILAHIKNQLTFDLWYIFLGFFCICASESKKIMDPNEPAFSVFAMLFEVTSGYGNVGLSLGYPGINTSLSGKFSAFGKLIMCAMMLRGRHRGLPSQLDRAVMLPSDRLVDGDEKENNSEIRNSTKIKRYHTH
ncbi:potassium transporter [Histoplasma ohiense]|nr:potassium transporter [Histoplasma ohiense (nom. inval.)]